MDSVIRPELLAATIGSAIIAVIALISKEVTKTIASSIFVWGTAFMSMPTTIGNIKKQVDDIDRRLGKNGDESVFDMLHALDARAHTVIAKERLRADRDGALLWHSDNTGNCIWASKGLQELVGATFDESFRGMNWLNLYFKEDREEIGERWTEAVENQNPFIIKTRYKHVNGHEIPVKIEAYPLPDGAILGMVIKL